jgi:hypothetical protein
VESGPATTARFVVWSFAPSDVAAARNGLYIWRCIVLRYGFRAVCTELREEACLELRGTASCLLPCVYTALPREEGLRRNRRRRVFFSHVCIL